MTQFVEFVNRIARDEDGQDMVEYALLIGLISIVAVAALMTAGDAVVALWDRVTAALTEAGVAV